MARAARGAVAALAAMLALGGCSLSNEPGEVDGPVSVYVSLPLTGPRADDGGDAADGARLALAQSGGKAGDLEVTATYLDDAKGEALVNLAAVGANARAASSDQSTAAYIGELDSGATRTSLPILNDAGIAQVSPGATAVDLTTEVPGVEDSPDVYRPSGNVTFTRVIPSDAVVAAAQKRVDEEGTVEPALALESLPPPGREFAVEFRKRFGREPGPYGAYGYEAMGAVLEAIERRDTSQGLRPSVIDALLTLERLDESAIGPYSFTTDGDTTLCEVQVYDAGEPLRKICPTT